MAKYRGRKRVTARLQMLSRTRLHVSGLCLCPAWRERARPSHPPGSKAGTSARSAGHDSLVNDGQHFGDRLDRRGRNVEVFPLPANVTTEKFGRRVGTNAQP